MDEKNNSSDAVASPLVTGQALASALRDRTTLRYMGDCKCGKCQLVPRDLICQAADELDNWRDWGVIEVAIRNPAVFEYINHWEGRTEKAEASNAILLALLHRVSHLNSFRELNDILSEVRRTIAAAEGRS